MSASVAACAALASPDAASAHATLERTEALTDSYYKATLRVPHGCEGSPTLRVRVLIPEGVTGTKPQPKPGWQLMIRRDKLSKPFTQHGKTITEDVAEVTWTGKLLDEHLEEFGMMVKLPDAPGETLYFRTVQECEKGVHRWIEIPAAGQRWHELKEPAPFVKLLPKPKQ
jgi:uncharacterized protein YcnI